MFLSKKHIDLLFEISDVHYQCFQKFYSEYGIKYSDVLQLNHKKMIDILRVCDSNKAEEIFEDILREYQSMLSRKKK
jgi:adenylate cyclase